MSQKLKEAKDKTKRRGNNEGSIYQRKHDNRWCGSVTIGYKTDGKPIRKVIYGNSRQEVAKQIAAKTAEVFASGYTTVSAREERNFKALFAEWFDLFVVPGLASVTEESRRYLLKNHIYPAFGAVEVQRIDTAMLQRFFNEKSKKLATDTVNKMKHLLNNFFTYATRKHLVQSNPMSDVVVKKVERQNNTDEKSKALRPEIRQDVFKWVAENPVLKPIVLTFAFMGLRPQELIALKWETVNLEGKTIGIKKALNRTATFDETGNVIERGVAIGKTKTPKSVRTITMPAIVVEALREWRSYCEENVIVSEFVFPNTESSEMRTYSGLRSLLTRFLKRHNIQDEGISLYTFRHTFATMLLEERENPKIVASLMGHAKVSTTLDIYSHVINSAVYENTAQTLDGVYAKLCR